MNKINIAIDGYSSCGKSTLAKDLAKHLQYVFIDTGAMYRAVTLFAIENQLIENGKVNVEALTQMLPNIAIELSFNAETLKSETYLNGRNVEQIIRQAEVSNAVSEISKIKAVREKLVDLQQSMIADKGVVMDGRDIGTVVMPNAELKLFMTASHEVRTDRRFNELQAKGTPLTREEVSENLKHRDYEDTHRAEDPLKQAPDAIVIDNTHLSLNEQFTKVLELVNQAMNN